MPGFLRWVVSLALAILFSCQSPSDQLDPWSGAVSFGLLPGTERDWATTVHAFSMPDPEGWGTWWQFGFDPTELVYLARGGVPTEDDFNDDPVWGDFSFSRDEATLSIGTGVARHLGDRILAFGGIGWAMAYEHEYRRVRIGPYDYREEEHVHYLTSGANYMAGLQFRATPEIGIEVGYQSFYETWYLGVAVPF